MGNGVRRMNEVNPRQARLVPGWVTSSDGYTILVGNQPTRSRLSKSSTSFGWGKGGNVTSAGWQVTHCDHMACEFP